MKRVITADLFCGAGGASTGIHRACNKLNVAIKNYCVNHWDVAIKTHCTNHPNDVHECAGIATPFVVKWETNSKPIALDEPITTQTSAPKFTLCTPIIVDTANAGHVRASSDPLTTLTTKNSMHVVSPIVDGSRLVDVCFRMMRPDELKRATGFGDDYFLAGNQSEQVKQIGNAVPVNTAESLAYEALGGRRY